MRILVMDGAATGAQAQALIACLSADVAGLPALLATRIATGRGAAEQFPLLATELFAQCGWGHAMPDLAGVVVGPGSFTGLRASLAFAHGLAAGAGCTVVGVTGGEVMAPALHAAAAALGATALHCTMARRGRVFIETPGTASALGQVRACMLDAPDLPPGPLLLAGNGAQAIMEAAGTRGGIYLLPDAPPDPQAIAAAALLRLHGHLPPRAAQPLYVDAPEAKLPAAGLRPAPVTP
ncbi:tRNA (adenosine(37)-N6)-threonylcarbamoyltransferase complex dimerization subunit type 1 TsaB [Komagataeibacter xylinus]|uniref:tRNA (adenosine(37)-N6)-threonylcarbamoyltransferase complex dimerization subunit type 1 TsaB n=1 Tax=Komagataeibacter xylinus TaxID=28448 RepID=UPI000FDF6676|nr:tRNA (adenosine(37)-N6)-threonylcarbamoyltransferase complex dimerization subunit type 1 TsaB [Komagataeibacter xylinus]AZV39238.1 tRNA (adenosine(37)-N6)-threonylcarbamoyltransferase complex dimerization subunit type 1 TsaB [Komagataeibacter xylinus]